MKTHTGGRKTHALVWPALALLAGAPAHAQDDEGKRVVAAVEDALQRHAGDAHRCLEKAVADTLDASGKVEIEVTLGPGGRVKSSALASKADTVTPLLADCIVAAARTWRIDGLDAGAQVVMPLNFAAMSNQFVVKAEHAPERGPQARGKAKPPFSVRILADGENMRTRDLAVTLLSVSPANRVAMTRHPSSDKLLYLLKGRARLLGPSGTEPISLTPDTVVFIPRGYPHVIENMGRQLPAEMLQVFTPPGPERVYRDPKDVSARAAFEVVRDAKVMAPEGAKPVVVAAADREALAQQGGKMSVRVLLGSDTAGASALGVDLVEFAPGSELAKHSHDKSAEFLYVVEGGGKLGVGNESLDFAAGDGIYLPAGQPHQARIGADKTVAVQIYAPAGPEQRFKTPAPATR